MPRNLWEQVGWSLAVSGGLGKASRMLKLGFEGRLGVLWANKL